MQNDFVFWLNTIVILLVTLLLGVRLFFPGRAAKETKKAQKAEKESLLALLREVIQSLRAPETARLMSAALLKRDIPPFVKFIRGLQNKLRSFTTELIGREETHKLEENIPFQLRDASQHEPLNIALSVADCSLEHLIRVYDGELSTIGSVHLYSLLAGWKRLRQGYERIQASTGVELSTATGTLVLPPATERIIRLTTHVSVHAAAVKGDSLKVLAEVWEALQDERVPSLLRDNLTEEIQRLREELSRTANGKFTAHHLTSEHPRLEAEAEAIYIQIGLLTGKVVEVCASWFLIHATLEIQRKHDALEAGKSAFKNA